MTRILQVLIFNSVKADENSDVMEVKDLPPNKDFQDLARESLVLDVLMAMLMAPNTYSVSPKEGGNGLMWPDIADEQVRSHPLSSKRAILKRLPFSPVKPPKSIYPPNS